MEHILFLVENSLNVNDHLRTAQSIIDDWKGKYATSRISIVLYDKNRKYLYCEDEVQNVNLRFDEEKGSNEIAFYDVFSGFVLQQQKYFWSIGIKRRLVLVFSDGIDNNSTKLSASLCALAMHRARVRGWHFLMITQTMDGIKMGRDLGMELGVLYDEKYRSNVVKAVLDYMAGYLEKQSDVDVRVDPSENEEQEHNKV